MYSYDQPYTLQHTIAAANFASQANVLLPNKVIASRNRVLETASVLGFAGVVGTAGTGTISIGDGTTAARYGTFVITAGLAVGASVTGTLTLTDEGSRIAMSNLGIPVPPNFVLTFTGTAVINLLIIGVGYY